MNRWSWRAHRRENTGSCLFVSRLSRFDSFGEVDLQHQPLVVGAGGAAAPIEITMRDDMAEISGTVDGVAPPGQGTGSIGPMPNRVRVYCILWRIAAGSMPRSRCMGTGALNRNDCRRAPIGVIAFDGGKGRSNTEILKRCRTMGQRGPWSGWRADRRST